MKALVTRLNGTVNNSNIPVLGFFPINFSNSSDNDTVGIGTFGFMKSDNAVCYIPDNKAGYFIKDENKVKKYTTNATFDVITVSGNPSIVFIDKYNLTIFKPLSNYEPIDIESFIYSKNLKELDANLKGFMDAFDKDVLNSLQVLNVRGKDLEISSIELFKDFKNKSISIGAIKNELSGNCALLPGNLCSIALNSNTNTNLTYVGTRPSNSKVLTFYGNPVLNNIDDFLIDNAKFISNSNLSDYPYKTIELTGTRTSTSDAAVQALQSKGFTVSITPA